MKDLEEWKPTFEPNCFKVFNKETYGEILATENDSIPRKKESYYKMFDKFNNGKGFVWLCWHKDINAYMTYSPNYYDDKVSELYGNV